MNFKASLAALGNVSILTLISLAAMGMVFILPHEPPWVLNLLVIVVLITVVMCSALSLLIFYRYIRKLFKD